MCVLHGLTLRTMATGGCMSLPMETMHVRAHPLATGVQLGSLLENHGNRCVFGPTLGNHGNRGVFGAPPPLETVATGVCLGSPLVEVDQCGY